MGTNYYIRMNACPHCGRGDEDLHIGKSSGGWKFLFAKQEKHDLTDSAKWMEFIKKSDGKIYTEYSAPITAGDLIGLIIGKQNEKLTGFNCYQFCGCSERCREWNKEPGETIDAYGFRITDGHEFY